MTHGIKRRAPNTPLPGTDPERSASYVTVFFGAPREYGPNEGWQIVQNKHRAKRARRYARIRAAENDVVDIPSLEIHG
jgi:hypothetical protein